MRDQEDVRRSGGPQTGNRQGAAALEAAAHQLGYDVVRLDTGPRQPHARGMYLAEGYREIPNFNGNPVATFFGEKRLSGD